MAELEASPISQLLHTLGITREDLNKRSDQMRQFLTADNARPARVSDREDAHRPKSTSTLHTSSRSIGSSSSLARSMSRASSASMRENTPPATPVKHEPQDLEIPHRRMDSMEMVLERQRRQRKNRREKERESARAVAPPSSPSPSNASLPVRSLESVMKPRDDQPAADSKPVQLIQSVAPEPVKPPPITPQKSKYYRDHTNLSASSSARKDTTCKTETPTPTRVPPVPQLLAGHPLPSYYAYSGYVAYPHFVPVAYRPATVQPTPSTSSIPITPQAQRIQVAPIPKTTASPFPPSSPPPPSSPMSSPTRRVNLVSSPGPMGPPPAETEYDDLPYTLPPGPYSPNKPDLSYAALVGRAILSSPEHRLTLQEIYDWITIVYPHYKRGETTWMNSIRHVLSTTVCFRKVPRDRSIGRTLWAIFDEDLECFAGGGFKKHLCKDYVNATDSKDKIPAAGKGKSKGRKRADEDDTADTRKAKKPKKDALAMANVIPAAGRAQGTLPLFPPTRPTTHHQPYYQSVAQPPPPTYSAPTYSAPTYSAEVLFPPLPPTAAFNRFVSQPVAAVPKEEESSSDPSPPSSQSLTPFSSVPPSISSSVSSMSASSVPDLTPNNSSSPPSSLPPTSDIDIDMTDSRSTSSKSSLPDISSSVSIVHNDDSDVSSALEDDDDNIFNTFLRPVHTWNASPGGGGLQPGIQLRIESDDEDSGLDRKGKKRQTRRDSFGVAPSSPTLNVRRAQTGRSDDIGRPLTPISSFEMPTTPPRSTHKISSIRTPISHKGLHMSPSASLAHYKSNLDPPPIYAGGIAPLMLVPNASTSGDADDEDNNDNMRTPRKRLSHPNNANVFFGAPVTPRKLNFGGTPSMDSPFRTPGGLGVSPFRTPGSHKIIDPHDPHTLLNEELSRSYDASPGGLFGKKPGSLLYDSPGYDMQYKWW